MLPYAGTPEFFTQEERRNDVTRRVGQASSSAQQSVSLPQPLEPRPDQRSYGPLVNDHVVRQSGSNDSNSAYISNYSSSERTLPGLRDILTLDSYISPHATSSSRAQFPLSTYEARNNEATYSASPNLQPLLTLKPAHSSDPHETDAGLYDRRSDPSMAATKPDTDFARTLFPVLPHNSSYRDDIDHMEAWHKASKRVSSSHHKAVNLTSPDSPLGGNNYMVSISDASYERPVHPRHTSLRPEAPRRYLGVKDLPGEGTFHLYEDGFRIPTQVDGEVVNPQWGLTKANKPRKRLALACLYCRDKKTRCEPGVNGCLQCVKAKRTCPQ
jgi:hypothetical protein